MDELDVCCWIICVLTHLLFQIYDFTDRFRVDLECEGLRLCRALEGNLDHL